MAYAPGVGVVGRGVRVGVGGRGVRVAVGVNVAVGVRGVRVGVIVGVGVDFTTANCFETSQRSPMNICTS